MTAESTAPKRRMRIREVEELYINGYCAMEIHDLIGERHGVVAGTIRNDIVVIRKMWATDVDKRDSTEGKRRYLASCRQVRRKAMTGYKDGGVASKLGAGRIRGRNYKLANEMDKEIARLSGVTLVSDSRTIHLNIQKARDFMEEVMAVVFEEVSDEGARTRILARLQELGDGE